MDLPRLDELEDDGKASADPGGGHPQEGFALAEPQPLAAIGEDRRASSLAMEPALLDLGERANEPSGQLARRGRDGDDAREELGVGERARLE